jgi:hypothetical protein
MGQQLLPKVLNAAFTVPIGMDGYTFSSNIPAASTTRIAAR